MMFRHVMVPYDGSDHAKNALNYAKDLVAGDADAKLSVVHAVPSSYMGVDRMGTDGALDGVPYGMLDYEEYQGVVKRVLDEAQKRVAEDLGDALADLGDRAQVEAVAGGLPLPMRCRATLRSMIAISSSWAVAAWAPSAACWAASASACCAPPMCRCLR